MRAKLEDINSFDANQDGIIDENELDSAVNKSIDWANHSTKDYKHWFYYGIKKPVGPMTWQEIEEISEKYPDLFVSYHKSGNSAEIKNWLPGKIILTVRKDIIS